MTTNASKRNVNMERSQSRNRNEPLEKTCLGIPLWLYQAEHQDYAAGVMRVIASLDPEMFTGELHRQLHAAYVALAEKRLPPSEAFVQAELMAAGAWSGTEEGANGRLTAGYLDELVGHGDLKLSMKLGDNPVTMLQSDVLPTLRELSRKRELIRLTNAMGACLSDDGLPDDNKLSALVAEIEAVYINTARRDDRPIRPLHGLVMDDLRDLESELDLDYDSHTVSSGLPSLDKLTGGFQGGDLIIVAGRPSHGKTALALDFAWHAAANEDRLTFVFSLEMQWQQIVRRIASKQTNIPIAILRKRRLAQHVISAYHRALGGYSGLPLFIDDRQTTPNEVADRIYRTRQAMGAMNVPVGLIVIDYLQLMGIRDKTKYERRERQIATYTGQSKALAKELDCPVILLSQLSREIEKRSESDRIPRLQDLRESGAIEQDADIVIGWHRKYVDTQSPADEEEALAVVMKNRNGPIGRVPLKWIGTIAHVTEPS